MNRTTKRIVIWAIIVIAAGTGIFFVVTKDGEAGKLDAFAMCLKDKGTTFYGAFWCPHCQNQKALFGNSAELLPYVECSTSDGKGQLQVCQDKKIKGYPTWEFSDSTRKEGEVSLKELADKTGCALPQ